MISNPALSAASFLLLVQAVVDGLKAKLLEKEAEVRKAGDSAKAAARREVCTWVLAFWGWGYGWCWF